MFSVDKRFERFEDITPEMLKKAGVKLLMCDLDNTLRLHSEKEPSKELIHWAKEMKKAGIKIVVVSNNLRKKMMQKFCEPLDISFVSGAKKPLSIELNKVITKYHFGLSEVALLGDKWSTDVLAGKFAKIRVYKINHRRNVAK